MSNNTITLTEFITMPQWKHDILRSVHQMNGHLSLRLNDLKHMMNDQLIDLKYGKGYKATFLDDILIGINNTKIIGHEQ